MADKGKKGRKIGRAARRPSTARRRAHRPDLFKKARNVRRCNGEPALAAWVERSYAAGQPPALLHEAARKAKERAQ